MEPYQTVVADELVDELVAAEHRIKAAYDHLIDGSRKEHKGVALAMVMTSVAALQQYLLRKDYRLKKPEFLDLEAEVSRAEWRWHRYRQSASLTESKPARQAATTRVHGTAARGSRT